MAIDTLDGTAFFEYWSKLAREDPSRFERERKALIERTIAEAPAERQPKLRELQAEIDEQRSKEDFLHMGMLRLHHRMWESYVRLLAAWSLLDPAPLYSLEDRLRRLHDSLQSGAAPV